jgi:hypothetical protein
MLFFERHRGYVTERAVAPRRVVERLDVVEDGKLAWRRLAGIASSSPVSVLRVLQNDSIAALS